MKILAIDTATEACSAALLIDGQLIAREMEFERGHSEHILPMVDSVLSEAGLTLAAMDALAFGRGPGGFTGVRLAASVVQGLAFAADRPVVPVSDLAAVAQRAFDLDPAVERLVVCNDARMKEVYWGCYERTAEGFAAMVGDEHVTAPDAVEIWPHWRMSAAATLRVAPSVGSTDSSVSPAGSREVPAGFGARRTSSGSGTGVANPDRASGFEPEGRPALIGAAGRGFRAYPDLLSKLVSSEGMRLVSDAILPRAHEIARLAVSEVKAGRAVSAEQAIPVYLRDNVARPQTVTKLT